jgi:YD repeat-containing protein
VKDGLGSATTIAYDQFDLQTRVTDALGHYRTLVYDKNGNVLTRQRFASGDTKLEESVHAYDQDNRLTLRKEWAKKSDLSTSIGSGWVEGTFVYDKAGLLVTKQDPCGCGGGATTISVYDGASRLVTMRDSPPTYLVRHGLDRDGRTTKVYRDEINVSTTRTYVTEQAYDGDGHLTKVEERGGGTATALSLLLEVDAQGRVRKTTDPNGNEVFHRRDDFGRVVKVERLMTAAPTFIETRTIYDLNDNVISRILERGATDGILSYVYDAADRLVTSRDEGATDHEIWMHDAAGRVSFFIDRNGSEVAFEYDDLGQVTRKAYTLAQGVEGPTEVKFYYDALGRVISAFNGDAKVERAFNTLSKLERERTWIMPASEETPGVDPFEVDYTYDGDGQLLETEYPDNATTVKRLYDSLNRVTKIQEKRGGGSYADVATWTFQGPSRPRELELGNGTREVMTYDEYGRLTRMVHDRPTSGGRATMYDFKRGYDPGSRPTFERRDYCASSTGSILGGVRDYGDRYGYDRADRLTKVIRGKHPAMPWAGTDPGRDGLDAAEARMCRGGSRPGRCRAGPGGLFCRVRAGVQGVRDATLAKVGTSWRTPARWAWVGGRRTEQASARDSSGSAGVHCAAGHRGSPGPLWSVRLTACHRWTVAMRDCDRAGSAVSVTGGAGSRHAARSRRRPRGGAPVPARGRAGNRWLGPRPAGARGPAGGAPSPASAARGSSRPPGSEAPPGSRPGRGRPGALPGPAGDPREGRGRAARSARWRRRGAREPPAARAGPARSSRLRAGRGWPHPAPGSPAPGSRGGSGRP